MSPLEAVAYLLAGAVIGAAVAVVIYRRMANDARARALAEAAQRATAAEAEGRIAAEGLRARLETNEATYAIRLEELNRVHAALKTSFEALCAEALRNNNEQFLQLARTELERVRVASQHDLAEKESAIQNLLTPIRDGLAKYDEKIQSIEKARLESFATLAQQVSETARASDALRDVTANLSRALTNTNVRGAWGELQLKRAIELSGMVEHCDFTTQETVDSGDGRIRPDVVVNLPGARQIVIDAKAPATAILEAVNCDDAARRRELCREHVTQVRRHLDLLSRKAYWEQFAQAPDFVVLFLPAEAFYSMALEIDPRLFEESFAQRVLITTPTTLVALLKAVAYGWRQEHVARNAQEVAELGKELYDRIRTLGEHFEDVGKGLTRAVTSYNRAVGSLENRVLPSARRFEDLGVTDSTDAKELAMLQSIELTARLPNAPELVAGGGG